MLYIILAIFSVIATTFGGGFTPPRDQPDGIYHVPMRSTDLIAGRGNFQHPIYGDPILIRNATHFIPHGELAPTIIYKRAAPVPITQTECMNVLLDRWHFNGALMNMAERCDSGEQIPSKGIMYSKYGSAIFYACQFSRGTQGCDSSELAYFVDWMDAQCGSLIGGFAYSNVWSKTYGMDSFATSFCNKLSLDD